LTHALLVLLISRPDELVIADAHALPKLPELACDLIHKLLRGLARGCGRALDLLPVLVGAGKEIRVVTEHPVIARHDVTHDRCIRVPNMRPRVDVVDRGGDVKLLALGHRSLWLTTVAEPNSHLRERWNQASNELLLPLCYIHSLGDASVA